MSRDIKDAHCILHMSCQFTYSQPVNGKIMYSITVAIDCLMVLKLLLLIVTSLHELQSYFPFNDGYNISYMPAYIVRNNIVGHPVKFTGAIFDFLESLQSQNSFSI